MSILFGKEKKTEKKPDPSRKKGKLLVFTAPSGAGKTTIVRHLLKVFPEELAFSVSATTREPRNWEQDGRDYYFLTEEAFREKLRKGNFLEWEEVYDGQLYGTLKSEIERLWAQGKHIIFDIDVKGAVHIKRAYPEQTLTVFVKPPSLEALRKRLLERRSESPEQMKKRLNKATLELTYESQFDRVLINDQLERALAEAETVVREFL